MTEAVEQSSTRARSGKSAAAFRTISEVATELEVPQHVLRFWETKFSQVRPLKRAGGRRYYRPEDVELLRRIRDLLYANGYTIKGVQKLLREGGARALPDAAPMAAGAVSPAGTGENAPSAVATAPVEAAAATRADEAAAAVESAPAEALGGGSRLDAETRHQLEVLLEALRAARALLSARA